MACHRSTVYINGGHAAVTPQFRFMIRLAVACHARGIPYEVEWAHEYFARMRVTITARGGIPAAKALPKPPRLRLVPDWRPAIWDAEYRLDAYFDGTLNRLRPGFVIPHSCGLSLVHPCESGELGVTEHGADEDIRQNRLLTHTASGRGFGLTLNFKRSPPDMRRTRRSAA